MTHMPPLEGLPEILLAPVRAIVEDIRRATGYVDGERIMLVGAWCRDIWHHAQGHRFATSRTSDLDFAVGVASFEVYESIVGTFPTLGDTGIRFRVAGHPVDVVPFGPIEDPPGVVALPGRDDTLSVWAFDEIHRCSERLPVSDGISIRIPTVPGYAAAKLCAWLDRSAWGKLDDAADLALIVYWYEQSDVVTERLYGTAGGNDVLGAMGYDLGRASAYLLGVDIATAIGPRRTVELVERWPGRLDLLLREFRFVSRPNWCRDESARRTAVSALTDGLSSGSNR